MHRMRRSYLLVMIVLVKRNGLLGDGPPAELRRGALPPGAPHLGGQARIVQQTVDRPGERRRLGRRHQQAGAAVVHDLGNAAHGAGHDRGLAGHRLEIDDAERLVDRGADEDRGVRQQLDHRLGRGSISGIQKTPLRAARSRSSKASTSAPSSGVSAGPASRTSCVSGRKSLAADSSTETPFCRVTRPRKATYGRLRSIPNRSRTSVAGSGW